LFWTEEEYQYYLQKSKAKPAKSKTKSVPKKRAKYNNKHTWIDGICFDSKKEADYYLELKLRLRAGDIKGFCRQPSFVLVEGDAETKAITYSADFIVFNNDGSTEIIDVKGYESQQWIKTYKMFTAKYHKLKLKIIK
jgi:hypothetical protein